MTTALLVAVMVVLYSFQSLFLKLFSSSRSAGEDTSTVFSISYGAFAGIATLLVSGFHFAPSPVTWACGLINAVVLLLYNLAMIKASKGGSYSFQMIMCLFGGITVPMVYHELFMGERLSALQFAAIGLMLVSFVLMNLRGLSLRGSSKSFLPWCVLIFVTNGLYSILLNTQQAKMAGAQRNEMIVLTFLGMSILSAVIQLVRDKSVLTGGFRMSRKSLVYLLACCLSATIACHLVLYVLTLVDATVLFTIDNGGVLVLSVLYSCFLFHEKLTPVQIAGIVMATGSIVMLSF